MKPGRWIREFLLVCIGILHSVRAISGAPSLSHGEWEIKTWETDDGLPENSATAMVQDSEGYLWFGTFKGLVRFDGVRFKVFDHSNTAELPSDGIVNIYLDRAGRLWVSTLAGLVFRDSAGWHLQQMAETPQDDCIRTFTERANGDLLLTTFFGRVFEFSKSRLSRLPPPPGEPGAGYFGSVDEDGNWWVAQYKFVGRWNAGRWEAKVPAEDLAGTKAAQIGLTHALDGSLLLLLNSELRKYSHGEEVSRVRLSESPGNIWQMTTDSQSNVWICTMNEGVCQLRSNGEMERWNEQNGISYHGTRFVFEDREKNLWVGTSGGGLQRFKLRRFRSFGPEAGLTERVVKSVSPAPDGGLWIGTYGKGLFRWTEAGITNVPLAAWTNSNLYVQAVLSDREGRTWVGTFGTGLFQLDSNNWRRFPPEQLGGNNVAGLFEDSHGRIWISGVQEVLAFENGELRRYGKPQEQGTLAWVCCFAEDNQGTIWLSNIERVFRLEKNSLTEVKDDEGKSISGILCLKPDAQGSMWMGSAETGLVRWKKGSLSRVGVRAGLAAGGIHGILYDEQGSVWLPSNRGVMRVRSQELESVAEGTSTSLSCQLLDRSDGLSSVECPGGQAPTCALDSSGRLWFATMKGVAMIHPTLFRSNSVPPQANIEEIVFHPHSPGEPTSTVSNRHLSAPFVEPLQLPPGCRGIEISYTAPTFISPEKVKFQIKLDGQELDWQEVGDRRVAYFDELEAGKHVFQVRAANDDGLWNQNGASLTMTVLPFFWQTRSFRGLLVAGACAAALLWAYRLKTRFEEKKAAHEAFARQLILYQETERKRVASELHDGLGQDLIIIKNRLGMLTAKAAPEFARQLQEISATTSRTIREVRSISHALRPSALEQVGLTKALEWMVEQLAEASSSKFSSELENIDGLLSPEMEINLYRIVQEALNNVLKHANASVVIVEMKKEAEGILVSVFDNGQGFEPAMSASDGPRKEGFGLISMAERAKVIGGKLEVQSTPGIGTRLILRVALAMYAQ